MCIKLRKALKTQPRIFFDVSGGCGIDLSLGESSCMASDGLWFKYCPFCGAKIDSKYHPRKHYWSWKETKNYHPAQKLNA